MEKSKPRQTIRRSAPSSIISARQKPSFRHRPAGSGIYRETMTEPGVYWFLDAPFVQIIGLYSNLLESPGYLQAITKGKPDTSQLDWLEKTLASIGKAKQKKALVIAMHHPPYSQSGHSESPSK